MEPLLDFILGNNKSRLLFYWVSHFLAFSISVCITFSLSNILIHININVLPDYLFRYRRVKFDK